MEGIQEQRVLIESRSKVVNDNSVEEMTKQMMKELNKQFRASDAVVGGNKMDKLEWYAMYKSGFDCNSAKLATTTEVALAAAYASVLTEATAATATVPDAVSEATSTAATPTTTATKDITPAKGIVSYSD